MPPSIGLFLYGWGLELAAEEGNILGEFRKGFEDTPISLGGSPNKDAGGSVDPSAPSTLPRSGTPRPCNAGEGFVRKPFGAVADSGSLPSVRPRDGGFMGPKGSVCMPKPGAMAP